MAGGSDKGDDGDDGCDAAEDGNEKCAIERERRNQGKGNERNLGDGKLKENRFSTNERNSAGSNPGLGA